MFDLPRLFCIRTSASEHGRLLLVTCIALFTLVAAPPATTVGDPLDGLSHLSRASIVNVIVMNQAL